MGFIARLLSQNTAELLCLCGYNPPTSTVHLAPTSFGHVISFSLHLLVSPSVLTAAHMKPDLELSLSGFFIQAIVYDGGRTRQFDFDFVNVVYVTEMLRIINFTMTRWKVICLKCHHADLGYSCGVERGLLVISVFPKKLIHSSDNQCTPTLFFFWLPPPLYFNLFFKNGSRKSCAV